MKMTYSEQLFHKGYHPGKKRRRILARAMEHINSVPYKVSLRWVFYRLYQEGIYKTKKDYRNLDSVIGAARKSFYEDWRPDTLSDSSRERIIRVGYYRDVESCLKESDFTLEIPLSHFYYQEYYIEIWYEANAMTGQFQHYTEDIDLVPMGGQASIPYKYEIGKSLEEKMSQYKKPIIILYFGDCDYYGHQIIDVVERDINNWTDAQFKVIRCGVTPAQAKKYRLPENPEKPGQYQWEALSDEAAKKIIESNVNKYVNKDIITVIQHKRETAEEEWSNRLNKWIKRNLK